MALGLVYNPTCNRKKHFSRNKANTYDVVHLANFEFCLIKIDYDDLHRDK